MKPLYKLSTMRSKLPILNTILVKEGMAYATDVDNTATMPTAWPDGLYCAKQSKAIARPVPSDLSPADWPSPPPEPQGATFTLDLESLHQCNAFASDEETRYYLMGVYLTHSEMVATDGHCMAIIPADIPAGTSAIIHRDTIALLPAKGTVTVTLGDKHVKLTTPDLTVIAKLIDGRYPEYQRALPRDLIHSHAMPPLWRSQAKETIALAKATRTRTPIIEFQFGKFNAKFLTRLPSDPDSIQTSDHPREPIQANIGAARFVFMPIA